MRISELSAAEISEQPATESHWYAMRATYHRELAVKNLLDLQDISNYLPLAPRLRTVKGRKHRVMEPMVSSLIFVCCDKQRLQRFKAKVPYLQYMTHRQDGRNVPIIVPGWQMEQFMQATRHAHERLVFLKPEEIDLAAGKPVRIHGGMFDGLQGSFVKVAGRRNKRVVIEVKDVIAVALECSDANFVEVL